VTAGCSAQPYNLRHSINLAKGLTPLFVLTIMLFYNNFTAGPAIYLALHG
jgi:hypothetical protein